MSVIVDSLTSTWIYPGSQIDIAGIKIANITSADKIYLIIDH